MLYYYYYYYNVLLRNVILVIHSVNCDYRLLRYKNNKETLVYRRTYIHKKDTQ